MTLRTKRVYQPRIKSDGYRILVDRLWPRGISKELAGVDLWLKDVAPSLELRRWFAHKPERFKIFSERYIDELTHNPAAGELFSIVKSHQSITLVYAAKDDVHNNAAVLRNYLERRI